MKKLNVLWENFEGLAFILAGVVFLILAFFDPPQLRIPFPFSLIVVVLVAGVCFGFIVWKKRKGLVKKL